MSLEMKQNCEKCNAATEATDKAYICSHECTFCTSCTEGMDFICPNCSGKLVTRPPRN